MRALDLLLPISGIIVANVLLSAVRGFAVETGAKVRWWSRSWASERVHLRKLVLSGDAKLARRAALYLRVQAFGRVLGIVSVVATLASFQVRGCGREDESPPMASSGPESWSINGVEYRIDGSHYERSGASVVLYVVEYAVPDPGKLFGMTDDAALESAMPLMEHAYETRSFERERFEGLRGHVPAMTKIAVDLVARPGDTSSRYRIVQSVGEIVSTIRARREAAP